MGTVEHPHQHFLVIDARQHNDHRGVVGDQIQVVFGEVKVDGLKSKWATPLSASICVPTIMEPQQQKLFHVFVPPPLNLTFNNFLSPHWKLYDGDMIKNCKEA